MYKSNIVTLSTGYVQFADPTKPWDPTHFPSLPSTALSLGAQGRIEDGNLREISFTNAITYEPYEPPSVRANLTKALHINASGAVSYAEPKVGYLSTFSATFSSDVTSFQQSTLGGAHIRDVTTPTPDTITNALGKLDAWIANAFLLQPPLIAPIESETNALYGGVRWLNFDTYSILDKYVPYVSHIVLTVGNPSSAHYLRLKIANPAYFPHKTYKNGISPTETPLVRLRIFTDFFVGNASTLLTKAQLAGHSITVLEEQGNAVLPSLGYAVAIDETDHASTYTTLMLYLPNLAATYPKGAPVPVHIAYANETAGPVATAATSTVQLASGAVYSSTVNSATYSDPLRGVAISTVFTQLPSARVRSLVPRLESPGTSSNIDDGVSPVGSIGAGLNVTISSVLAVQTNGTVSINPTLNYDATSNLTAAHPDTYGRELYLDPALQKYRHPYGLTVGSSNFTNDLADDANKGYRYATFLCQSQQYAEPTPFRYMNITVHNPSLVSSIGLVRDENNWFPNCPTNELYTSTLKVRMHAKLCGAYATRASESLETGWINCLKERDGLTHDDSVYDLGACARVTNNGSNVVYKTEFNRRFYTKLAPLVRVGIARDAGSTATYPISFSGVSVEFSDT